MGKVWLVTLEVVEKLFKSEQTLLLTLTYPDIDQELKWESYKPLQYDPVRIQITLSRFRERMNYYFKKSI